MELSWSSIQDVLTSNHVPEIILAFAGLIALIIIVAYLQDKDSGTYKMSVLVGLIMGILLIILSIDMYGHWALSTSVIMMVAGFALVIRPFRDVQIAVIIGMFVMGIVYLFLGDLAGGDFDVLASGWPRIGAAVLAGALVFLLTQFLTGIVQLFGKILNFWPVLFILALICLIEAVSVYLGYGSIYDLIMSFTDSTAEMLVHGL